MIRTLSVAMGLQTAIVQGEREKKVEVALHPFF